MRIHADLKSLVAGDPEILQVEKTPAIGVSVPINGKFVIPSPPGVEFPVDTSSYVLDGGGDVDGSDVTSRGFAHLLARYPQFNHLYFNPLLTAEHVNELDFTTEFRDNSVDPPNLYPPRFQTGRPSVEVNPGQMPTHTALLAQNETLSTPRPGMLMSVEIDLSAYVPSGEEGFREFMLYWRILDFNTSMDVASDYGVFTGQNSPAVRYVLETDQEPAGFGAYVSPDNGGHWCQVGLLTPIGLTTATKKVRMAFLNTSDARIYLAHFALFF